MARVLIVDDLEFMRAQLRDILKRQGHELVGEARNGREALMKYAQVKPDLVLLDITMPEMDGIAALRRLRNADPACRVIMCSAISEHQMILKASQLGARDYVVKPFREERIHSAIQRAMGAEAP